MHFLGTLENVCILAMIYCLSYRNAYKCVSVIKKKMYVLYIWQTVLFKVIYRHVISSCILWESKPKPFAVYAMELNNKPYNNYIFLMYLQL